MTKYPEKVRKKNFKLNHGVHDDIYWSTAKYLTSCSTRQQEGMGGRSAKLQKQLYPRSKTKMEALRDKLTGGGYSYPAVPASTLNIQVSSRQHTKCTGEFGCVCTMESLVRRRGCM